MGKVDGAIVKEVAARPNQSAQQKHRDERARGTGQAQPFQHAYNRLKRERDQHGNQQRHQHQLRQVANHQDRRNSENDLGHAPGAEGIAEFSFLLLLEFNLGRLTVFANHLWQRLLRRRNDAVCSHRITQMRSSYNEHMHASGRILAIDYGSRRMGLAVSDPLGITAQGLETLERRNKRSDFARLERVLREQQVAEIVLGNPLRMSGEEGRQSQKVAEFAEELRRRFAVPVHLWDERLTSAEANRLLREMELSLEKRTQAVDRMAATLILQSFLQARSAG